MRTEIQERIRLQTERDGLENDVNSLKIEISDLSKSSNQNKKTSPRRVSENKKVGSEIELLDDYNIITEKYSDKDVSDVVTNVINGNVVSSYQYRDLVTDLIKIGFMELKKVDQFEGKNEYILTSNAKKILKKI